MKQGSLVKRLASLLFIVSLASCGGGGNESASPEVTPSDGKDGTTADDHQEPAPPLQCAVGEIPSEDNTACVALDTAFCGQQGRSPLWARYEIDADLMQDFIRQQGVDLGRIKVAIVDSGLDQSLETLLDTQIITRTTVSEGKADPLSDTDGHGSFIAGIIAGVEGLGVAPGVELGIFKLGDEHGGYPYGDVWKAVQSACDQGYRIINVSQGYEYYEIFYENEKLVYRDVLSGLAAQGCMVVKSAGNRTVRWNQEEITALDDAYLLVEAAASGGELTTFSSVGEIRAPGKLFSFALSQNQSEACSHGAVSGGFAAGTSFATPLVSGVLANVRAVLVQRHGESFAALKPEQQIQLLNRILLASLQGEVVNGYNAVRIAAMWQGDGQASVSELKNLMAQSLPDDCGSSQTTLQCDWHDASSFQACYKPLRQKLATCHTQIAQPQMAAYLDGLAGLGATDLLLSELSLAHKRQLSDDDLPLSAAVEQVLTQSTALYQDSDNWFSDGDLNALLIVAMDNGIELDLAPLIHAEKFINVMNRSEQRGAEPLLETMSRYFASRNNAAEIISSSFDQWADGHNTEGEPMAPLVLSWQSPIGFVRVMDTLISDARLSDQSDELLLLEAAIFERLNREVVLQLPELYSARIFPDADDFLPYYPYQPLESVSYSTLAGVAARHPLSTDIRENSGLLLLAALAQEHHDIVAGGYNLELSWQLLPMLAEQSLYHPDYWRQPGKNPLLQAIQDNLNAAIAVHPGQRGSIAKAFQTVLREATDATFLIEFSDITKVSFWNSSNLVNSMLVDEDFVRRMYQKTLRIASLQDPQILIDYVDALAFLIGRNKELISVQSQSSWSFVGAEYRDWLPIDSHRLSHIAPGAKQAIPTATGNEVFELLVAAMAQGVSDKIASNTNGYYLIPFHLFFDAIAESDFCSSIDASNYSQALINLRATITSSGHREYYPQLMTSVDSLLANCGKP